MSMAQQKATTSKGVSRSEMIYASAEHALIDWQLSQTHENDLLARSAAERFLYLTENLTTEQISGLLEDWGVSLVMLEVAAFCGPDPEPEVFA